jgi:hypothetical protein
MLDKAGTAARTILQRIGAAVRAAATKAANALKAIATKVSTALSNVLRRVIFPALDKLRATASKHLVNGQRKAKQAVKLNTDHHLAALDKVAKTAVPAAGGKGGGAGAADDPAATFHAIGQKSRENNALIVNTARGRFGTVLGSLAAMAIGAATSIGQQALGLASQAIATVSSRVQAAIAAVKNIAGAVASHLRAIFASVREALGRAVEWVRGVAAAPVEQLASFGSRAVNAASGFISRAIQNVLSGNFSLPSLGLGAFQPTAASQGPVPTDAVTNSVSSSSTSILQIVGIVVAVLVGLVMLPAIIATLGAALLIAAALLVAFGPLLALAAIIYGIYKFVKWVATPSKLEIEHKTQLDAPDGSPKTRTVIGVGERVTLKANKLVSWKATGGDPTSAAPKGQLSWQAPRFKGDAEITAEMVDKTQTAKLAFSVVEPSSTTAKKEKELGYPAGRQGVGMKLQFIFGPSNVSFGGVEMRELSGPASDIKGYYEHEGMPHQHDATPKFYAIGANNQLAGETRDTAAQQGMDPPWDKGSFHWQIPNEFRADEEASPKTFAFVTQEFVMADDTGTTTVSKGGASATRKP